MTLEEYRKSVEEINQETDKKKLFIEREFAFSNSNVEVGDVVTDHVGSVKVENIKFTRHGLHVPYCVYYGVILNKTGKPNKKGETRAVHHINIVNA